MNNETQAMVIRKLLTIVGSGLVAKGVLPETVLDQELIAGVVGVVMLILTTYWSKQNANKLASAKESEPDDVNALHPK